MTDRVVPHVPVVILGAGPTGVTVATLLAQYGVECLLLDRWAQVYPQPRAVHLDDEVYRILARLGVAEEFAEVSRPALGLRLVDGSLRTLAEFTRATRLSRNGFPQANMFDQPDLERLLRTNLQRYPRAEFRGDVEVRDVTQDGSRALVTYARRSADGDLGAERVVSADYVLGCDGANSVTRRSIGSAMADLGFDQRWLVVDVATSVDLHQWEGVHQVCDPDRAGTYMRIGERRYRWEFRLRDHESAADFATLDAVTPLIRPWTEHARPGDLKLVRATEYTFRAQLADRWRCGRILLLGDAAHLTPPFIGQGMGAGLRDAANLAWKVAAVLTGALPADVLDSYERERKPHARHMIRLALAVGRAMTAGGRAGDLARRLVVPRMHLLPGLRAKVLASETPALHRSALVRKRLGTGRLAGRLCPNPVLAEGGRLDDVLGDGFALLTTGTPTPAERELIDRRGATLHVAAPGSELATWLGRAGTAIVRPDRTVLATGRRLDTLCTSLPTFNTAPRSTIQ